MPPTTLTPGWLGRPGARGSNVARPPHPAAMSPSATSAQAGKVGSHGGVRDWLFYRHVRREFAAGLVRERGYDWQAAREAADDLSPADIDVLADEAKIGRVGGAGGFLQWLLEHGPQILQLISLLLALFGGKASAKLKGLFKQPKQSKQPRAGKGKKGRGRKSTAPPKEAAKEEAKPSAT